MSPQSMSVYRTSAHAWRDVVRAILRVIVGTTISPIGATPLHAQSAVSAFAPTAVSIIPQLVRGIAPTDSAARDSVARVLNPVYYGVPSSPAFELLPDQPSEVTHVVTPKDFQTKVQVWQDLQTVRAGVAFDARPFVARAGDLTQYSRNYGRRLAFRTVLSAGTATAAKGSEDVLVAAGLRIPLVDFGDPRADTLYQDSLSTAYRDAIAKQGAPPFDATPEQLDARAKAASEALDIRREAYARRTWNARKVDLGLAASGRALSGRTNADSARSERAGIWSALSVPLGSVAQLTLAGKSVWARTDTITNESLRAVAGARLIALTGPRFSASAEVASVWSRYRRDTALNERWTHLGILAEWAVPELGGWLGVSYGGDSARRESPSERFAIHYALYRDRILK